MRKPVVDYRKLRLSNVTSPEFRHLFLLLGWLAYLAMYVLTEQLIPVETCKPVHIWLDDVIPFCEWFVIPYVLWYGLIAFSLGYFLLYDVDSFQRLQIFITITQTIATIIYILYPTRQDLRPDAFPRENVLTLVVGFLYRIDTNTGVCPSLHVGVSLAIASVWSKQKKVSKLLKGFVMALAGLICLATVFIKQHSALDFFAALPVCIVTEWIIYGRDYWPAKFKLCKGRV